MFSMPPSLLTVSMALLLMKSHFSHLNFADTACVKLIQPCNFAVVLFCQSQLETDVNNVVNVTSKVVLTSINLVDQINTVINNITGNRLPTFLDEVRNYLEASYITNIN